VLKLSRGAWPLIVRIITSHSRKIG
jgi:hypothetical protein